MKSLEREKVKQGVGGKLFNFRPALFFALFCALGVSCAYAFKTDGKFLFLTICCLLLIPVSLFLSGKKSFFVGILLLAFFALGISVCFSQMERYDNPFVAGRYETTGKIVDGTAVGDYVVFTLEELTLDGENTDGIMLAYFDREQAEKIRIGDKIIFVGEITPYETANDAFSHGYVADGVRFNAYRIDEFARLPSSPDLFQRLRLALKERLYAGMSNESAAFVCAVLTGDTSGIESGLLTNVRLGGVAHIFAVSGLHIGALYAFCRLITDKTAIKKSPRIIQFLFVAFVLIFYGGICRYTSSVLRAVSMCLTSYAMRLFGVKSDALERIGVAMLLCLVISPASLFTAGFLLSFGASFGICAFSRTLFDLFSGWFYKDKERPRAGTGLCGFFAAAISAQTFTAPLCLHFFGYVSFWGLFLNSVFVPLLTATFSLLLALGWVCCLLPIGVSSAVLSALSTAISGLLLLFHAVDFSFALFVGVKVPLSAFICYYSGLAFSSDKINLKKGGKIAVATIFFVVFLAVMIWTNL